MASQSRSHRADPKAAEDDNRQYGHGPLSLEELEAKYKTCTHFEKRADLKQDTQIVPITTTLPFPSIS
jgi:hypothetical protein